MERFWLKNYPDGVPADIDPEQFPSLIEMFEESFAKFGDRKAAICMDKAITYGELDAMSAAIGAYLQSKGLARGSRVAVMMPNVLQNPITGAAALRAGCTVVNVNPLYTPRELEHQLKDSGRRRSSSSRTFCCDLGKGAAKNEGQAHRHLLDRGVARPERGLRKLCRAQGEEDGPCLSTARRRLVQECAVGRSEAEIEET